jgi:hypothetical protein
MACVSTTASLPSRPSPLVQKYSLWPRHPSVRPVILHYYSYIHQAPHRHGLFSLLQYKKSPSPSFSFFFKKKILLFSAVFASPQPRRHPILNNPHPRHLMLRTCNAIFHVILCKRRTAATLSRPTLYNHRSMSTLIIDKLR